MKGRHQGSGLEEYFLVEMLVRSHSPSGTADGGRERTVRRAALAIILVGSLLIAKEASSDASAASADAWGRKHVPLRFAAVLSRASASFDAACGGAAHTVSAPLFVFFLPLGRDPVPVDVAGLRTVGEVALAAVRKLSLPAMLGRTVTAADVRLFVLSREEALRLAADGASTVLPEAEPGGTPLTPGALDANLLLCKGNSLLVVLAGPRLAASNSPIAPAPSLAANPNASQPASASERRNVKPIIEKSSRLRIAILFSGQLRQVNGLSFRTIDAALLSRYDCDVYGTFGVRGTSSNSPLAEFEELYSPVLAETYADDPEGILRQLFPPPETPLYPRFSFLASGTNKLNVVALYDGLNRSYDQLQRGLAAGRGPYDWVVRLRTDAVIAVTMDLAKLERGYVYVADLRCIYDSRNLMRNEFFVMPGDKPETFDLLRGVKYLHHLNIEMGPSSVSFVDEALFMAFALNILKLGKTLRVTDYFTVWKTRDGSTTMACKLDRGKYFDKSIHYAPFNVSQMEFWDTPPLSGLWYGSPPFFFDAVVPEQSQPAKALLHESVTSACATDLDIRNPTVMEVLSLK